MKKTKEQELVEKVALALCEAIGSFALMNLDLSNKLLNGNDLTTEEWNRIDADVT